MRGTAVLRHAAGLVLLLPGAWASAAPELTPADFAYGMPVVTATPAAAYRVSLPLEVYRRSVSTELHDLRVFNAAGEVVPFELQQPAAPTVLRPQGLLLPLFALRGDPRAALEALRVSIESPAGAFSLQAAPAAQRAAPAIGGYLIDARGAAQPLAALQLDWPEDAPDYSGAAHIEASDDLSAWQSVIAQTAVVNLHSAQAHLTQNRITLPGTRAKFYRLTWIDKAAPFALASIAAEPVLAPPSSGRASLSLAASAADAAQREFSYDLQARLPVDELNVELPQANSAAEIEILSRPQPGTPWRAIARGRFYRVQGADAEHRNPAIAIAPDHDRFWLLRVPANAGTDAARLRLQLGWQSREVVFMARGAGPYLLAYGRGGAPDARMDLTATLREVSVEAAELGAPRTLGGAALLNEPRAGIRWRLTLLWLALAAGIALLAFMAYRLAAELRSPPGTNS